MLIRTGRESTGQREIAHRAAACRGRGRLRRDRGRGRRRCRSVAKELAGRARQRERPGALRAPGRSRSRALPASSCATLLHRRGPLRGRAEGALDRRAQLLGARFRAAGALRPLLIYVFGYRSTILGSPAIRIVARPCRSLPPPRSTCAPPRRSPSACCCRATQAARSRSRSPPSATTADVQPPPRALGLHGTAADGQPLTIQSTGHGRAERGDRAGGARGARRPPGGPGPERRGAVRRDAGLR